MLEIIGVGYGRTGTLSLKRALEQLGYGKCYHFSELLKRSHARRWLNLRNSDSRHWKTIFDGYSSTTDWPAAAYYKELAEIYPDAKFILTHRNTDDWYASAKSTIFKLRTITPNWLPGFRSIAKLTDQVIWHGTFGGRFLEKNYAINCYHRHIEEVCDTIPSERLLVFDVRDGWSPLCTFLGKPIPVGLAFPNSNDRRQVQRIITVLRILKYLIPIALVAIIVVLVTLTATS